MRAKTRRGKKGKSQKAYSPQETKKGVHATYTLHTTSCNCTPYTAHYVLHAATCTNVLPQSLCHLFSCSSTLHDGRGTLSSCSNNPPRKNKTGLLMLRLSKAATSRGCYVLKALYLESPLRKANPALFGRRNPSSCTPFKEGRLACTLFEHLFATPILGYGALHAQLKQNPDFGATLRN